MKPLDLLTRRGFLGLLAGIVALGATGPLLAKPRLRNPCRSAEFPGLEHDPRLNALWQGIDPHQFWDCHVHLAGTGDSNSGIVLGAQLASARHPLQYGQRLVYMNGGCTDSSQGVDISYVARLLQLIDALPPGAKTLLFAFDRFYDEAGRPDSDKLTMYVPDEYARSLAAAYPARFEWAASIHPYRNDSLAALQQAIAGSARAIKWLPSAMGIDPAAPRCDDFYRALATADLPLIVHCGQEQAVEGKGRQHLNNPLRLRRALDAGVRVVVAHCASVGTDIDLDRGPAGPRTDSFRLFSRMMDEPRARGLLFGDISAITLRNRPLPIIKTLLSRTDWHSRLLHGSDYPLPGILPLIAPAGLARAGLLPKDSVGGLEKLREHNPLFFDFALKRLLRWQGNSFAASVFQTRLFFTRT
ncbi:MAG: amidohydrolase family protein [Desulfobulbus sp.]|jgi:mannonate dehydratase|uniref:amidohydrolase family protein n=1 Tax=Desulfobulbus sp. TaxID=895 RepID=UPI00284DE0F6|nr:amidohydrolase family protein [Desulfobulbus sp.]MDR2548812.1 amidohydrolase family protein [Desulfobulbus sp.]